MTHTIQLSIIIVNFNTPLLTLACLNSLVQSFPSKQWEIIIVDNGSTDDSVSKIRTWLDTHSYIPGALIELKNNRGFAAANNIGITQSFGEYVLLLNSDTEAAADAIRSALVSFEQEERAGAVTLQLRLSNGNIDTACHRGFPTPWAALSYFLKLERIFPTVPLFSSYHQLYKNFQVKHEVDAISGAFFLTSKQVIADVGLLDESFFMYAEDIDWCYRMKQKGYRIVYDPVATVLHKKKQSGRDNRYLPIKRQTQMHFFTTMKQFYDKHYATKYPRIVTICIHALLDLRIRLLRI